MSTSLLQALPPLASEVFITAELARRPPKRTDYLQEKLALQDLAARMADNPGEVLPRFVELAMQVTGGVSAGLSLYEEEPAPGVFRWRFLCGCLAAFEGTTTPRHDSPCGVTLDQAAPILARHAERLYKWIADANIVVPEVLLVPLFLGGSQPLGTLWVVSEVEGRFDSGHARVLMELAAFVGIALRMQRTEERLRQALEAQEVLTREMSHRLTNVLQLADSMIRLGARSAGSKADMAQALSGRLQALASAHALVLPGFRDDAPPSSVEFGALLHTILRPHQDADGPRPRFTVKGPPFACDEHAVTGLALVIHELATNAAKYGALKSEAGHVECNWRRDGERIILHWTESGGPAVEKPERVGFGSQLVQSTIVGRFHGAVEYDWRSEGLIVTIDVPAEAVVSKRSPVALSV